MKRYMVLAIAAGCLFAVVGCNRKSRRPCEASDSDGIPTAHEVLVVDVEEKVVPLPGEARSPAPVAPTKEAAPAPAPKPVPAVKPAPQPQPKTVATAKPKKGNPLKAAFNKNDVLAVAEDTPRRTASTPKKKPAPKPKKKDTSPSEEADKKKDDATDKPLDPETQAVQDTIVAFAKAVETADVKGFRETLAYSKADEPILNVVWSLTREMSAFEKDMKKTYGQEGVDAIRKNQLMKIGGSPPSVEDIRTKMTVKVVGNKAQASIPSQSRPMTLVKVNGGWKVQLIPPGQAQGPQAQMITAMMKSMVGGVKKARQKIGKPGMTPKKIMALVNSAMMPGPGLTPANMKPPKRGKRR